MLRALFIPAFVLAALAGAPAPSPFAPLEIYNGTWTVRAQHSFSGNPGPDTLTNHCHVGEAFYTCEQIVNGKPAALLIFTLSSEPGKFDVDSIMPNGHASSDTDLLISGPHNEHWTFVTNSAPKTPSFRVENTFSGPNAIHFEMFSTTDAGKTWTKVNEGDDTRNP